MSPEGTRYRSLSLLHSRFTLPDETCRMTSSMLTTPSFCRPLPPLLIDNRALLRETRRCYREGRADDTPTTDGPTRSANSEDDEAPNRDPSSPEQPRTILSTNTTARHTDATASATGFFRDGPSQCVPNLTGEDWR